MPSSSSCASVLLALVRLHPAAAAELDRDRIGDPLGELAQVVEVLARADEPARELEQDGAELAGRLERLERRGEHRPDQLAAPSSGRSLRIEAALLERVLGQLLLAPARGSDARVDRVLGEQPERLDVEDEVRRRSLDPERGVSLGGKRVVGGVDLDERKALRVVAQAVLRRACASDG